MAWRARWRVGNNLGVGFEDKSNWLVVRPEEIETTRGERAWQDRLQKEHVLFVMAILASQI
jgi:hypothetical protein